MALNIEREVAALQQLTVSGLQQKFLKIFGDAPRSRHREWLIRRIVWRLQANAEGDLSERARQRARELANHADLRVTAPAGLGNYPKGPKRKRRASGPVWDSRLPGPGAQLTRCYKGQTIVVTVLENGFEFRGETLPTLTAVAKIVTGSHWNGFHFFGLAKQEVHS